MWGNIGIGFVKHRGEQIFNLISYLATIEIWFKGAQESLNNFK